MDKILLQYLQVACFMVSFILSLILLLSRIHIKTINRRYESSRWELFTCMMLLSVQFFLQILFDFRGQGADVAALVNILFYSPAAYLLFHTNLKMASTKEKERLYAIICGTNFALIVLCYIIGAITYKSLHMPHALYAMELFSS